MNSELFFEGKKYISSKRASKISRYNQDYIGQLIRDNKLVARRVGRSWFVSQESLEKHLGKIKGIDQTLKSKNDSLQKISTEESKPLYLEGKKFISSKEASDLSGYSRDYIGQLVRKNVLEAKMVGRLWYVSLPSLQKHIGKQAEKTEEKPEIKTQIPQQKEIAPALSKYQKEDSVFIPNVPKKDLPVVISKPSFEDKNFVYVLEQLPVPEKKIIYPTISPKKSYSKFYNLKRTSLAALIVVGIIFGANVIHFEFSSNNVAESEPNVLASASVLSASSFESFAVDWYKYVNDKLVGAEQFLASLFGTSELAYQAPTQPTQTAPQGMVVMPSSPANQQTIDHIKNSFSDQVGVSQNPDAVSGVITPVFKKVSGDQYLYVLVPVKQNKQ